LSRSKAQSWNALREACRNNVETRATLHRL